MLWRRSGPERQPVIEAARVEYLSHLGNVLPMDTGVATIAAEISALLPFPQTPAKRTHRAVESKQDRLVRWRADTIIAATALAADMPLIHNNAGDFEAIRGAIERDPQRFPGFGPLQLMRCVSVV